MPVLTEKTLDRYRHDLIERYEELSHQLKPRTLTSPTEGCSRLLGWSNPENMRATLGSAYEIRLAAADFKAILSEISKLK